MGDDEFEDFVLQMHRCRPRCYELAGTRTANVRDQLLRATLLVRKLCEGAQRELTPANPLLVVGGGAAGVAAALTASAAGVPCVLLERRKRLLQCQWEVKTRWLDPTEFDWPHPGWEETSWPPDTVDRRWAIRSPLIYEDPAEASILASRWQDIFDAWTKEIDEDDGDGAIHVQTDRDRSSIQIQFFDDHVTAVSEAGYAPLPMKRFGALVSCVGLGDENVVVDRYGGPLFWSTDKVATRDLGFPKAPELVATEALISGGGDGAQQDVLRVLCGNFGRRLLRAFGYDLKKFDTSVLAKADEARHIALHNAGANEAMAEAAIDAWEDVYSGEALQFWQGLSERRMEQITRDLLRPEVLNGNLHLTWVLRGNRPTYCYGLNRFLTELALLAYATHSGRPLRAPDWSFDSALKELPIVLQSHELATISSADKRHSCHSDEHLNCHEHLHWASVRPTGASGTAWPSRRVNLVIVRHGLRKAVLFGGAPVSEQRMPYWLPDH